MNNTVPTIPLETFQRIAESLRDKTKRGHVNWIRRTGQTKNDIIYEVELPNSRIVLKYGVPIAEPDYLSLQLQNTNGVEVDSWVVDDPDPEEFEIKVQGADPRTFKQRGEWSVLHSLFSEVHRHVTGWDKVVNDVQSALAGSGTIGLQSVATR